ncbi:MAG TPA: hypothetical protein VL727_22730 [Puia sp.]|jgi:hypothetical protein|nr:hypothetical protein [Puia sp.]
MLADLNSSIRYLEETNNPADAYFSYSIDNTGEFGLIKANKEGLRLYAAEILKKSQLIDDVHIGQPIFFNRHEWMDNEAGCELIAGILPQYDTRREIMAVQKPITQEPFPQKKQPVLLFFVMCITGALIMLATLKAFPNLRLWVNIH